MEGAAAALLAAAALESRLASRSRSLPCRDKTPQSRRRTYFLLFIYVSDFLKRYAENPAKVADFTAKGRGHDTIVSAGACLHLTCVKIAQKRLVFSLEKKKQKNFDEDTSI